MAERRANGAFRPAGLPDTMLHCVDLLGVAGTERMFDCYVHSGRRIQDRVLTVADPVHPWFRDRFSLRGCRYRALSRWYGVSVPEQPKFLRRWRAGISARGCGVSVFWNVLPDRFTRTLTRTRPAIYYDHSLAWQRFKASMRARQDFRGAIACSHASARMLRLNWGFDGRIATCRNPVTLSSSSAVRRLPRDRCFTIGLVGRLTPAKGGALALHALAELKRRSYACRLAIAGEGAFLDALRQLAIDLDIADRVRFLGVVSNMDAFYEQIDCLLHPALCEPSGLTIGEAMGAGCPVIASRIDGIPEWFDHETAAGLVKPSISAARYIREFGGARDDLPPVSYDPDADRLVDPAAVDPGHLADVIANWLDDEGAYERASAAGIARAADPALSRAYYVDSVDAAIADILADIG